MSDATGSSVNQLAVENVQLVDVVTQQPTPSSYLSDKNLVLKGRTVTSREAPYKDTNPTWKVGAQKQSYH